MVVLMVVLIHAASRSFVHAGNCVCLSPASTLDPWTLRFFKMHSKLTG